MSWSVYNINSVIVPKTSGCSRCYGNDVLDKNGDYAYLFEPDEDKFVELQLKD